MIATIVATFGVAAGRCVAYSAGAKPGSSHDSRQLPRLVGEPKVELQVRESLQGEAPVRAFGSVGGCDFLYFAALFDRDVDRHFQRLARGDGRPRFLEGGPTPCIQDFYQVFAGRKRHRVLGGFTAADNFAERAEQRNTQRLAFKRLLSPWRWPTGTNDVHYERPRASFFAFASFP